MDRLLRAEIVATVKRSVMEAMETYDERWLTAKELGSYISVMTARWLQDHGDLLPRTQIEYTDAEGRHSSSWLYPLHRIQAMMADGRIKELKN